MREVLSKCELVLSFWNALPLDNSRAHWLPSKADRPSARLPKKEEGKKKRDMTTNLKEIKGIRREYCEQLYTNKLGKLDEMENS